MEVPCRNALSLSVQISPHFLAKEENDNLCPMSRHVGQFLAPTVIPHARLRLSACVSAVGRALPVARIYEITWFPLLVDAFPPSLDRRSPATNSPNLRPFLLAVSPPWYQPAGKGFSLSQRVPNCCLLLRRPNHLPTCRLAERISLSRKTRFVAKADRENARVANANERGLETGGI